jgi:hypothetical protein
MNVLIFCIFIIVDEKMKEYRHNELKGQLIFVNFVEIDIKGTFARSIYNHLLVFNVK